MSRIFNSLLGISCTISKTNARVSSDFQTEWFYCFRAFGNLMKPEARVFEITSPKGKLVEIIIIISFLNSSTFFETWNANLSPTWCFKLRANGRNNSHYCCANNVGSCCVRVGNSEQTDATTPNIVGTCSASWEGYNP